MLGRAGCAGAGGETWRSVFILAPVGVRAQVLTLVGVLLLEVVLECSVFCQEAGGLGKLASR